MTRRPFGPLADHEIFPLFGIDFEPHVDGENELPGERADELMGSKEKFWLHIKATDQHALVKYARPNTGEHWSEKLAAEVARLLGVPHPLVELGRIEDANVSITLRFLSVDETLVHGNELLAELDPTYPKSGRNYKLRDYTIQAVHRAMDKHVIRPPDGCTHELSAWGTFIGYLLLDALIGNTDRHHENWGARMQKENGERILYLAPSYDHASSLGRELRDDERAKLLQTTDKRRIEAYHRRARSPFYPERSNELGQGKPLSTTDAFLAACALDPQATSFWRDRLLDISLDTLVELPQRVPESAMSSVSKDFASFLLRHNYARLEELAP